MNINWLVIPTLVVALLLFVVGQRSIRHCRTLKSKMAVSALFLIPGIPGIMFPAYYLHFYDDVRWFYEFRSLPFIELAAAGAGLFAGALAALIKGPKPVSRPFLIAALVLAIIAPHLKPVVAPTSSRRFADRWRDGVCMQSTPSSCGPASAASVFRIFGASLSERAIARECFTYVGGTENWYIARAFRRRGYEVTYRNENGFPDDLRVPAIAGVRRGGMGHFIAILDKSDSTFITGDPLAGREEIKADEMTQKFDFTGFFMEIQQKGAPEH
jgi:hypothetical protein